QNRHALIARNHALRIDFEVIWRFALTALESFEHQRHRAGFVAHFDHVADLHEVGRDGHATAVHLHVAVVHELTRREYGRRELRTIHHRIETALEQTNKVFSRVTLAARGFFIGLAELLFGDVAVVQAQLLLGDQLEAEVRSLALAALAVLARS